MARLVLSLDGQVMAEYNMNKERYTIGRLPDNDIRIDNAAVSGHHSLIINILNDSFLEDLNSTNGTYVNGKLIKKHALQHGDVITVGHHQLRFVEDDEAQDEFEKTMVIQPSARPVEKVRAATEGADKVSSSLTATGRSRALADGAAARAHAFGRMGEEDLRRRSLPLRIGGWEMLADVALSKRAVERIGERVQADVSVGMAAERRGMGDANAAQPHVIAEREGVNIEALADPRLARARG